MYFAVLFFHAVMYRSIWGPVLFCTCLSARETAKDKFCCINGKDGKVMGATLHHSRKKLDLTGQRFGKLTVLAPAENIGERTAWWCRCDCGKETVVKTSRLRGGRTISCGCVHDEGIERRLNFIDGTCVEMIRANTVRRNNTSGIPGVDWLAKKGSWRATICFKGKRYYLGSYKRFEDAVKARKQAEEELYDPFLQEFAEAQQDLTAG